jgi:hypothetical protein
MLQNVFLLYGKYRAKLVRFKEEENYFAILKTR